ncbi:MAG: 7-carboxy-7-deazaguanine synthase QueE [Prevotella sp.]|jgi:organic radical activating enzyme
MSKLYRVNEIFYSLQGEGFNTGRAAVFIRFSGCNLKCDFCDTDFASYEELTLEQIIERAEAACSNAESKPMIVLTGGEPTLQVDAPLIDGLHGAGFKLVAMESNGTLLPPDNLDWLTVSPKCQPRVTHCNEVKYIYDPDKPLHLWNIQADHLYLQPCDTGDPQRNRAIIKSCVDFIKQHPDFRLSLQTHKLVGFK